MWRAIAWAADVARYLMCATCDPDLASLCAPLPNSLPPTSSSPLSSACTTLRLDEDAWYALEALEAREAGMECATT